MDILWVTTTVGKLLVGPVAETFLDIYPMISGNDICTITFCPTIKHVLL